MSANFYYNSARQAHPEPTQRLDVRPSQYGRARGSRSTQTGRVVGGSPPRSAVPRNARAAIPCSPRFALGWETPSNVRGAGRKAKEGGYRKIANVCEDEE